MRDFYVITDAKIVKVNYPIYRYIMETGLPASVKCENSFNYTEVTTEDIKGRRFCKRGPKYLDVVIGWDSKLQNFLGVPIEAWEDYESEKIAGIRTKLLNLNLKINQASFFQRLKYLITRKL